MGMDSQLDLAKDQLANPRVAILYQGNRPKRNFSLISLFFLSLPNFGAITLHIAKTNQMEPAEFHI